MKFATKPAPGLLEIIPQIFQDHRGRLVKTHHAEIFAQHGIYTTFAEEYFSSSTARVLRGLHFQTPPTAHAKLVYCIEGEILDVVVDLRIGSPTYGKPIATPLTATKANCIFIPEGFAHGFYTVSDHATIVCKASTVYDPANDAGIRWDSLGFEWPDEFPVLSPKDAALPSLADYASPFRFTGQP